MFERGSILVPERKWPPGTWPSGVRYGPPLRLFTNAQVLGLSTAIIMIGFDATMASMSLAE
jgi:hypothetical protein